jgi:hypothetical protein
MIFCQSILVGYKIVNYFFPFAKKHMVCCGSSLQILLELLEIFVVNESIAKK